MDENRSQNKRKLTTFRYS